MSLKSTPDRYGTIAIAFHWITALLIVVMIGLGLNADNAETDELRRAMLMPHIALGLLTLVLTLARIIWWWFFDTKPAIVPGIPSMLAALARVSHVLIYAFIIALALTGVGTNVIGGVADALSTGAPIPPLDHLPVRRGHGLLAWCFILLLALHIAAALYHHFIRRDRTVARMIGRAG